MDNVKKTVFSALFAALICVATMLLKIPIPAFGYIHPGDGLVLLAGIFLGPMWGGLAAGFGSALADLISGYGIYVPATFFIKWGCAAAASFLIKVLPQKKNTVTVITGVLSEIIMVVG